MPALREEEAKMREFGHDPEALDQPLSARTYVAPTDEEARGPKPSMSSGSTTYWLPSCPARRAGPGHRQGTRTILRTPAFSLSSPWTMSWSVGRHSVLQGVSAMS